MVVGVELVGVSPSSIVSAACGGAIILFFRMKIILQPGGEEGCKTTEGSKLLLILSRT